MGRIKRIGRRFLACLMIILSLSSTVTSDYLGVQYIETVYATGVETIILKALIEAIMASMGLSFSSTADLNNAASGLSSSMSAYEDYTYGTASPFKELKQKLAGIATLGALPSLVISQQTYKFLQNYLYNLSAGKVSSASDVSSPITDNLSVDSIRLDFSTLETGMLFSNPVFCKASSIYDSNYDIVGATSLGNYSLIIKCVYQDSGSSTLNMCIYGISKSDGPIIFSSKDDGTKFYTWTGANSAPVYGTTRVTCRKSDYVFSPQSNCWSTTCTNLFANSYSSTYGTSGINVVNPNYSGAFSSSVYMNKDTRIYSSFQEYAMMEYSSIFSASSTVYGLSSTAKAPTMDDTTGDVSIPLAQPSTTANVEQAIADALADNPALTQEEANAIASDVIAAQNGTTDAVNQNTKTLSTLLTSILAQVKSIAANVSKISVGGGTAALDWTDVQEAFEEETVPGSSDNDNDDDEPKVWVPPKLKAVGFLAPLLMLLGGALSNLSAFQSKILGVLEGVEEWIMDIPENIGKALDKVFSPTLTGIATGIGAVAGHLEEWIMDIPESIMDLLSINELPLDLILTGILGLPLDVVKALNDSLDLDIDIPDIAIPNYKTLLDRIIELLEGLFLIDTAALAVAFSGFESVWEDKLPFGDKLLALFNEFYFSSNYNYPVIKVRTPQILTSYYDDEYIVLLDFADYKQYVLWARSLVKACLWFAFALSIFGHLRTNLHIG